MPRSNLYIATNSPHKKSTVGSNRETVASKYSFSKSKKVIASMGGSQDKASNPVGNSEVKVKEEGVVLKNDSINSDKIVSKGVSNNQDSLFKVDNPPSNRVEKKSVKKAKIVEKKQYHTKDIRIAPVGKPLPVKARLQESVEFEKKVKEVKANELETLEKAVSKTHKTIKNTIKVKTSKPTQQTPETYKRPTYRTSKVEKKVLLLPKRNPIKRIQTQQITPKDKYDNFTNDLSGKVGQVELSGKKHIQQLRQSVVNRDVKKPVLHSSIYDKNETIAHKFSKAEHENRDRLQKINKLASLKKIFWTVFILLGMIAVIGLSFYYYQDLKARTSHAGEFKTPSVLGVKELSEDLIGGQFSPASLSQDNNYTEISSDWNNLYFSDCTVKCSSFEDLDDDGLINLFEYNFGTDPSASDSDNDGLSDGDEVFIFHTSPKKSDSDNDGLSDGDEVVKCQNPIKNINGELLFTDKNSLASRVNTYKLHGDTINRMIDNGASQSDLIKGYIKNSCSN